MQLFWFILFILLIVSRILFSLIFEKSKDLVYKTAAYCIVGMYLISGLDKVINFGGDDTTRLVNKWIKDGSFIYLNREQLAKFLVIAGGLIELFGSYLILSSVENLKVPFLSREQAKKMGIYSLLLFTVLATFMFYLYPKVKVLPSISNINAVGGLLALLV